MRRFCTPRILLVGLVLCAVCLLGVFGIDRLLSRRGRIAYDARRDELVSVYDEVLRYECDNLELPETLSLLVPVYMRAELLVAEGRPLYRLDAQQRVISQVDTHLIGGLLRRVRPPVALSLPSFDASLRLSGVRLAAGVVSAPEAPEAQPAPEGAIVIEAEHFTEMNYGWEIRSDASCGGGAYAYSKEGVGNGPGQFGKGVYEFHNILEKPAYTRVRWHFHAAQTGRYFLYGRMWTTGTHCSNRIYVGIDKAGPEGRRHGSAGVSLGNTEPFRWVWSTVGRSLYVSEGDHTLEAFLHEDGVLVDQSLLSPVRLHPDGVYEGRCPVNAGTAFREGDGSPVLLGFDLESMVMTAGMPPVCNVTIRRLRPAEGMARVTIHLRQAAGDGGDLKLGEYALELGSLDELLFLPIDFGSIWIML